MSELDDRIRKLLIQRIKESNQSGLRKAGRGLFKFAKGIAKSATQDLIVTPGTKIGQVAAYGIGNIVGGERGEQIKQNAFEDQNVDLGPLGKYEQAGQRAGAAGVRQVGAQGLKAATWLYTPGGIGNSAAQQTFKQALISAGKSGAILGGMYGAAEGLENKDYTRKGLVKNTAMGAVAGAAGGAVVGGAAYGLTKGVSALAGAVSQGKFKNPKVLQLESSWQKLQQRKVKLLDQGLKETHPSVKNIIKSQKSIENQISTIRQAGFIKNPFAANEPEPAGSEMSTYGKDLAEGVVNGAKGAVPKVGRSGVPGARKAPKSVVPAVPAPQVPESTPQEFSAFYNVDRLNIKSSAKKAILSEIDNAGKQLESTVGKKLTNKEVLDTAAQSGKIMNQVVTREQTTEAAAANLNLRREIARVSELGSDGKLKDPKKLIELVMKDKSIGEDLARQLQARKIGADPSEQGTMNAILEAVLKKNKNADEVLVAAKDVNWNDTDAVVKFYRQFVRPRASEWIDLLRYNSMLSSPTTHLVNASSNFQGTGIITPIEKTITGSLDAIRSALTGTPRKYAAGEGLAYAKGYYSNVASASKNFWNVMRGKTINTYPDTMQMPLATSGINKGVEKTLNSPLRLLEASDQFFKTLTEGGLEQSLAYRAKQGIRTANDDIGREAAERLFRGEFNPEGQGYVLGVFDEVGNALGRLRHSENPVVSTIAKFTVPFLRTPVNLFKQGIEYSPLGITTLIGNANKTQQLSKIIIGSSVAAGAATLLGQDRLTWAEPTGEKQKAAFRAAGRQPYSLKIGNKWVSYSKLHPALAFNFALIAAIDDSITHKHLTDGQGDSILTALAKYGNFLADQSYLKNIGDMVAGVEGDAERMISLVSNPVQQLIPFRALMSYVERIVDPFQRKVDKNGTILEKQLQQILAQIPGAANAVPKRLDQFGAPIRNPNRFINAISPNRVSNVNKGYEGLYKLDELDRKMQRMNDDLDAKIESMIQKRMKELTK